MKNTKILFAICTILFLIKMVFVESTYAQSEAGIGSINPNSSPASFYYISKPGEVTMQVNIWGAVQKPGRYEIPTSTNMIQLISYAGGPNQDAKIEKVKVMRWIKKEGSTSKEEFFIDLEELSSTEESKLDLYPGDTIFIDHTSWSTVKDLLTVVTTAAIITSAIANVIIAERKLR